jgi:hypothetical protein
MFFSVSCSSYVKENTENTQPITSSQSNENLSSAATQTPEAISNYSVSDFINKSEKLINQPGWIHVQETTSYDIDQENNGVLPDGQVIPLSYITDTWYHINSDGLVEESVSIMKSNDGAKTLQTSIFTDNKSWSSSDNQEMPQKPYSLGALDHNFFADVQDISKRLSIQPEQEVSENISTFAITEKLDQPLLTVDYKMPVYSISTFASFDSTTGLLVEIKRIMRFENGSERNYFHVTMKTETGIEPPKDILALIEQRK